MSQECTRAHSMEGFQGWLVLCVRSLLAVRLAESQWEKSNYSLVLSSCSACHAREHSSKGILSEDFEFSNAKYVRDYWCTTAEIKHTFQVALSTFFACTLHLTLYLLTASFRYLYYYRDFKLCCCLSFWQQITCFRTISSHSVRLHVLSLGPGTERETFCFLFFCYYRAEQSILIIWEIRTKFWNPLIHVW